MSDIHPKTPLEIVTDIWSKNLSSIDLKTYQVSIWLFVLWKS
jgi:hypothetical protein